MPQIFQVLKCYKCSIFQVHQARKDNKWKCKVCGEKQSVKRHYGIGTAKDCRVHVQKLNCMRGDIEETKLKAIQTDSSNSDCEENKDVDEIQMKNTQRDNSPKKESKWSAFVENVEVSAVKEPEFIDNVEGVCLELPQKRKINRKPKSFKVPKVSNNIEGNQKTEIINEIINKLPAFKREESNSFNSVKRPTELLSEKKEINNEISESKSKVFNESVFCPINKNSKWAHYVTEKDNENDEPLVNEEYNDENMEYYDNYKGENAEYNYCIQNEEQMIFPNDEHKQKRDLLITNNCKETNTFHKSLTVEPMFSISDDNDLDNILDF